MNARIGEKIKELRKSKGYPLEMILEKLNVSESTYFRMEKGETASWTNNIQKICELYGIEIEELLLQNDKFIIYSNNKNGASTSTGSVVINNLSDKAIELYERMLAEKDKLIADLRQKLNKN